MKRSKFKSPQYEEIELWISFVWRDWNFKFPLFEEIEFLTFLCIKTLKFQFPLYEEIEIKISFVWREWNSNFLCMKRLIFNFEIKRSESAG